MERVVYFVINMFKSVEVEHYKIERLALEVVVTTRKLIPYFQVASCNGKNQLPHTTGPKKMYLAKEQFPGRLNYLSITSSVYPREVSSYMHWLIFCKSSIYQ